MLQINVVKSETLIKKIKKHLSLSIKSKSMHSEGLEGIYMSNFIDLMQKIYSKIMYAFYSFKI